MDALSAPHSYRHQLVSRIMPPAFVRSTSQPTSYPTAQVAQQVRMAHGVPTPQYPLHAQSAAALLSDEVMRRRHTMQSDTPIFPHSARADNLQSSCAPAADHDVHPRKMRFAMSVNMTSSKPVDEMVRCAVAAGNAYLFCSQYTDARLCHSICIFCFVVSNASPCHLFSLHMP